MTSNFVLGVQDCPHCMARVVILADGDCPRCRGNAFDTASIDPNKTSTWVYEKDVIPALCHRCGRPADRKIAVSHTQAWESPHDDSGNRSGHFGMAKIVGFCGGFLVELFVGVLSRSFGVKPNDRTRQFERITIRIPECPDCRRGDVHPVAADIPHAAIKIAVHRSFADEHKFLNNL